MRVLATQSHRKILETNYFTVNIVITYQMIDFYWLVLRIRLAVLQLYSRKSLWYSWHISHLALNNNHSLTHSLTHSHIPVWFLRELQNEGILKVNSWIESFLAIRTQAMIIEGEKQLMPVLNLECPRVCLRS